MELVLCDSVKTEDNMAQAAVHCDEVLSFGCNRFAYRFIAEDMEELTREANHLIRPQVLTLTNKMIATSTELDDLIDSLDWLDEMGFILVSHAAIDVKKIRLVS